MNKALVWTGAIICIAGVLMYVFIQLSSPVLWLVLAGIGLLIAIFGIYAKTGSKSTTKKK